MKNASDEPPKAKKKYSQVIPKNRQSFLLNRRKDYYNPVFPMVIHQTIFLPWTYPTP